MRETVDKLAVYKSGYMLENLMYLMLLLDNSVLI